MAEAKMQPVLDRFDRELRQAKDLVQAIRALKPAPPRKQGYPGLPVFQLHLVRELAFLRSIMAWEAFLQESFAVYLTGGRGLSGHPVPRHVTAKTLVRAEALVLAENDYLSWNSAKAVNKRAKIWFRDGQPYLKAFESFNSYQAMRIVRNRIAHSSGDAAKKFKKLCESEVNDPRLRHGMGPGAFLAQAPASQTKQNRATTSRFDTYLLDLAAAANTIANN